MRKIKTPLRANVTRGNIYLKNPNSALAKFQEMKKHQKITREKQLMDVGINRSLGGS